MFKANQVYMVTDYESRSEADIGEVGAAEYARHPSTEILCVAWRIGTRYDLRSKPIKLWKPHKPSPYGEFIRALLDPTMILVAHNSGFEQLITRHVLTRIVHKPGLDSIPASRWLCTASLAAALALPRKLEGACDVLNLSVQKDKEGKRLIQRHCKPQKMTKKMLELDALPDGYTKCGQGQYWDESLEGLDRLGEYCCTDVAAETELFLTCPPLTETERKVWELDQKMNSRGVYCDRPLVETVLRLVDEETTNLKAEVQTMTSGFLESATQRAEVLSWLADEGLKLPDLQAKTVNDVLVSGVASGPAKRMLQIRQSISKTSTAKYLSFEQRTRSDSRLRDTLMYHGASTGRWAGAGVQVQNLPRPKIPHKVAENIIEGLAAGDTLEWVRGLYGDPMDAFSSCLRGVITATPGHTLYCADYSAIEARGAFWVAKHDAGLKAYIDGRNLYCEQATDIYGYAVDKNERPKEYFLGKKVILGAQYGLGWNKFMVSCHQDGLEISEDIAKKAIASYRSLHSPIPKLWSNLERAAMSAVENKGKKYTVNRTTWFVSGRFLFCELPSGRRLAFCGPEVRVERDKWNRNKPTLSHMGVDSLTKQWARQRTWGGVLTENVVSAICRDAMAEAMLRVDSNGYAPLITVHDEILAERPKSHGAFLSDFEKLMSQVPTWATGFPIKVEGWCGERYRK